MQSVIEQATHALQLGRFEAAKTLVSAALTAPDFSEQRLPFLEVLAQAQTALQEHAAAASSWQTAYQYTTTAEEKARIFEHARQALHEQQDYATLLPLAQAHLPHSRTPQEQAVCLLAAGEALAHLQRYHEARQDYLQPALDLVGIAPETRLYLWHYLGLSHLSEQRFTEAAAAFQQSADLALGQHFANAAAHQAAQRAQLHHLRNAARFYEGVIHLIYQRPQRAVQSLQELQRPFTTVGALNVALFLGLAYRTLLQPEAALRALQAPARTAGAPDTLRGPTAVVRAGIANLQETPAAVGDHLAAALEAALQPQTAWEPAWQALLYREMGLVLQRLSCRHAALLCYEEGVQAVVQRAGMWEDLEPSATPRGEQLLAALEALPLQDWSAVAQGELWQLLQGLAGIYGQTQTPAVVDRALALALRVTLTPEQALMVWCQRGWYLALSRTGAMTQEGATSLEAGLQEALARCPETPITEVAHGIEALLQGDPTSASATLAPPLALPNIPEWQALCTSSWLWAHTQRGTLEDALAPTVSLASLPWQSSPVLALALEMLLTSTPKPNATAPTLPCLAVLLAQHTAPTLEALRLLCRPGYLSSAHYTRLLAELRFLCNHCDQASVADQVAVLLGSTALMERIETLVAALDQRLSSSTPTPPQATRQRKQRQRRELTPAESLAADTAHIVQLVTLLQQTPQTVASNGPEAIFRWLRQYSQMTAQAPEVVGALLGFLRQCPGATAVIPALLEQVSLSRRQRQALEATLQTPTESSTTTVYGLSPWDDLRGWTLGRLFEALETCQQPGGTEHHTAFMARGQYLTALVLARVGLLSRAIATVQDCLQLQPGHPMAHYTLAQWRLAAGDQDAALDHTLQAWHGLQTLEAPPQVVQLELLNHLLRLLENTAQANRVPEWMATFGQARARLQEVPLTTAQQQQVHAEEGAFALFRAAYLATTSPPASRGGASTALEQLAALEQAVALGAPATRHTALHRRAELLVRFHRYDAATQSYQTLVQHWPDDQRAQQRLALLALLQQPASGAESTDAVLAEALTTACSAAHDPALPATSTPAQLVSWLVQASPQAPGVHDIADALTAYGAVAVQRQAWQQALDLLVPLYTLQAQPQQAYYLALAYVARSQQAANGLEALRDCEQALQHVQEALAVVPTFAEAMALLRQIEAKHQTLMTVRSQEQIRLAYRQRIRSIFHQQGVPTQEHTATQTSEAPWVTLQELADVDETSGRLVTVVQLWFNGAAVGTDVQPDEADVVLYAQHQRDKQRLVTMHGMEALPWPHTAYEGKTNFAALFPERLGLNRDILFIAFADLHALMRYARVLTYITRYLPAVQADAAVPADASLAAAARYMTLFPLLQQRLQMLASATPSKVVQRQISGVCETLEGGPTAASFQQSPAFVDAYTYFHAIVDTMRAHLDTPQTERPSVQQEERQAPRPARRKRRQSKDRWRDAEPERRREGYFSDAL